MTPDDFADLDRYVAGEGSVEEREVMRLRIQASPMLAAIVEVMRSSHKRPSGSRADAPNPADAWHSISARLGFDLQTQQGRPRAPLALISSTSRRQFSTGRLVGLAAATLIIAGASLASWRALRTASATRNETSAIRAEYQTARGERATVELLDGTRVTLAPETQLRIAQTGRLVYLSGEAVFAVTHDPTRPFRVIAANGTEIQDIGTRFDVRDYAAERTVRVVVADGSVSLRASAPGGESDPVILSRGAQGVVDSVGAVRVTQDVSAEADLAWAQGQLIFDNARVADVVGELSRWYDRDIRLGDQKLADVRLTITLSDVPAEVAIDVIARALDVRIVRGGQSVTLYSRTVRE